MYMYLCLYQLVYAHSQLVHNTYTHRIAVKSCYCSIQMLAHAVHVVMVIIMDCGLMVCLSSPPLSLSLCLCCGNSNNYMYTLSLPAYTTSDSLN